MKYLFFLIFTLHAAAATLNGGTASSTPAGVCTGGYGVPFWFGVGTPALAIRATGTTTGTTTYKDEIYTTATTTAVYDVNWQYYTQLDRPSQQVISATTSNTSVLQSSTTNITHWTFVGGGTATISLFCTSATMSSTISVSPTTTAVTQLVGFATTSAAYNACNTIDMLITSATPSTSMPIYSSANDTTGTYTRNALCWTGTTDMTAIAVWNSYGWSGSGGQQRAGTLISPRHIMMANHFAIPTGSTIRFVSGANTTVTRTILAEQYVGSDIMVGILDSDVPAGINYVPVLAASSTSQLLIPLNYGIAPNWFYDVATIYVNQSRQVVVGEQLLYDGSLIWSGYGLTSAQRIIFSLPGTTNRANFSAPIIGGDSGSPMFVILNGKLVLLTCWYQVSLGGGGPDYRFWTSQINSTMSALSTAVGAGTNYQLTTFNVSGFTSY